ncbi:hypothetical protein Taro_022412 [Colocasia esculenta]|uniref:UBN2 domain-containing protein n=1 Tax=Colocasia esculenta TaxID=4460 RepID=A0A843V1B2_COLES|nr:hypothetical protein [Colocasia esculenta]
MLSHNSKAKNLICSTLTRSEFNRISAYKSAKEMWDKLKLTYEGIENVKETRIDILVTQYKKFQMLTDRLLEGFFQPSVHRSKITLFIWCHLWEKRTHNPLISHSSTEQYGEEER